MISLRRVAKLVGLSVVARSVAVVHSLALTLVQSKYLFTATVSPDLALRQVPFHEEYSLVSATDGRALQSPVEGW